VRAALPISGARQRIGESEKAEATKKGPRKPNK
jgi:hypothetical protein